MNRRRLAKGVIGIILTLCGVDGPRSRKVFRELRDRTPGVSSPSLRGDIRAMVAIEGIRMFFARPIMFILGVVVAPFAVVLSYIF